MNEYLQDWHQEVLSMGTNSGAACDFYDTHSGEYHERTFHIDPGDFLTPLMTRLSPGALVLDVGCSSGRDLCWFKKRGFKVMGFEGSPRLAELARKNAECTVIEDDFTSFDFSGLRADAILLIAALVHLPQGGLSCVLENISRALKRGGHILLTMKEGVGEVTDEEKRTFYLWHDEELSPIFERLGFSIRDFSRRESKLGTGEVWLEYVLQSHM